MRNAKVELVDVTLKGCTGDALHMITSLRAASGVVATRCEFANSQFGSRVSGGSSTSAFGGMQLSKATLIKKLEESIEPIKFLTTIQMIKIKTHFNWGNALFRSSDNDTYKTMKHDAISEIHY